MATPVETRVDVRWTCRSCDVEGRDEESGDRLGCWNCGGPVVIMGRLYTGVRTDGIA